MLQVGDHGSVGIEARGIDRDAAVLTDGDARRDRRDACGIMPSAGERFGSVGIGRQLERRRARTLPPPRRRGEEGCRSLWQCHLVAALDSPLCHSSATSFHSRSAGARAEARRRHSLAKRCAASASLSSVHSGGSQRRARRADRNCGARGSRGCCWRSPGHGRSAMRSTADRQRCGRPSMVGAWLVWGIGVVALVVPSTLGLTVTRMLAALGVWCGRGQLDRRRGSCGRRRVRRRAR